MKNVALMLPAMRVGGAEKIGLNFISDLKKHFKITLVLNKVEGEFLKFIPNDVDVLEDRFLTFKEIVKSDLKKCRICHLVKDFVYYIRVRLGKNNEKFLHYLICRTPKIKKTFDLAISYVANVSTQVFSLAYRIDATKKIAWIHGETNEIYDVKLFAPIYKSFDKIYCVSKTSLEHFRSKFQDCKDNSDVYYNPINTQQILVESKKACAIRFDHEYTNILTVGRISPEKGFDMIPFIVEKLKKDFKIKWYIIGDGPDSNIIKSKIDETNTDSQVIMLGTIVNPYPYMRECDIYVQPSYEEGYSTTICEAGILGKVIIGTSTSGGIYEQIEDGKSGLIAEPNVDSIAEKIRFVLKNDNLRRLLEYNVEKKDFSNKNEINKLVGEFI